NHLEIASRYREPCGLLVFASSIAVVRAMSSTRITATQSFQLRPAARGVIASSPRRMISALEGWWSPTFEVSAGAGRPPTGMPAASNNSDVSLPLPATTLIFSGKLLSDTSISRGSELRDHSEAAVGGLTTRQ